MLHLVLAIRTLVVEVFQARCCPPFLGNSWGLILYE